MKGKNVTLFEAINKCKEGEEQFQADKAI